MTMVKRNETSLARALRLRGFGLGERNPKTLPGSGSDAEMPSENREASARWARRGKIARGIALVGTKY
jgi:hypothetical protein